MSDSGLVGDELAHAETSRLEHVIALAISRIERHEPGAALTGLRAGLADVGLRQTLTPPATPTQADADARRRRVREVLVSEDYIDVQPDFDAEWYDKMSERIVAALDAPVASEWDGLTAPIAAFGSPPGMTATRLPAWAESELRRIADFIDIFTMESQRRLCPLNSGPLRVLAEVLADNERGAT